VAKDIGILDFRFSILDLKRLRGPQPNPLLPLPTMAFPLVTINLQVASPEGFDSLQSKIENPKPKIALCLFLTL
jgi:hypothetical protein